MKEPEIDFVAIKNIKTFIIRMIKDFWILMGGIIATCRLTNDTNNEKSVYRVYRGMQLLQHRGKAYWKISSGKFEISGYGSLPVFKTIHEKVLRHENDPMYAIVGHLSKKKTDNQKIRENKFCSGRIFCWSR